jgi:hypothetical protein
MIDILVTWPCHMDYPLFRESLESIHKHTKVNKIIAGFSNHYRKYDFRVFLGEVLPFVDFINHIFPYPDDWRNVVTNEMLKQSDADYVLFLEQDFVTIPKFWDQFFAEISSSRMAGWIDEGGRLHPSFLCVERELLNQTSLNFSANPPDHDHFGKVSAELLELYPGFLDIQRYKEHWTHVGGLTQNYNLIVDGKYPNYNLFQFSLYNRQSQFVDVPQDKRFVEIMRKADKVINYDE